MWANRRRFDAMTTVTTTKHADVRTVVETAPRVQSVANTFVTVLDSSVEEVRAALDAEDVLKRVRTLIRTVDPSGHLTATTITDTARSRLVVTVVWRFGAAHPASDPITQGTDSRVRVTWTLELGAGYDTESFLTVTSRFTTSDPVVHEQLLAAWRTLAPAADLVTRRSVAALRARLDRAVEQLAA
jgi:hypothetical protein